VVKLKLNYRRFRGSHGPHLFSLPSRILRSQKACASFWKPQTSRIWIGWRWKSLRWPDSTRIRIGFDRLIMARVSFGNGAIIAAADINALKACAQA